MKALLSTCLYLLRILLETGREYNKWRPPRENVCGATIVEATVATAFKVKPICGQKVADDTQMPIKTLRPCCRLSHDTCACRLHILLTNYLKALLHTVFSGGKKPLQNCWAIVSNKVHRHHLDHSYITCQQHKHPQQEHRQLQALTFLFIFAKQH